MHKFEKKISIVVFCEPFRVDMWFYENLLNFSFYVSYLFLISI